MLLAAGVFAPIAMTYAILSIGPTRIGRKTIACPVKAPPPAATGGDCVSPKRPLVARGRSDRRSGWGVLPPRRRFTPNRAQAGPSPPTRRPKRRRPPPQGGRRSHDARCVNL